jgi:uncharacterized membrane protein YedE/YeeE
VLVLGLGLGLELSLVLVLSLWLSLLFLFLFWFLFLFLFLLLFLLLVVVVAAVAVVVMLVFVLVVVETIGHEQGQHTTFAQSLCVLHQTHEQTAHLEAQSGMYHPERLHIYGGRQTLQTCKQVKSLWRLALCTTF